MQLSAAIIRYLPELAPDFVRVRRTALLDENGEIIGYEYISLGTLMMNLQNGTEIEEAISKSTKKISMNIFRIIYEKCE